MLPNSCEIVWGKKVEGVDKTLRFVGPFVSNLSPRSYKPQWSEFIKIKFYVNHVDLLDRSFNIRDVIYYVKLFSKKIVKKRQISFDSTHFESIAIS